jgi:hypothetical protein
VACKPVSENNDSIASEIDSTDAPLLYSDIDTSEFVNAFLVVADEGTDYEHLMQGARQIMAICNLPFNQLGRIYKKGKGIIVPENSDDEMYAGFYFPRRLFDDGQYCSIEMKGFYDSTASKDTSTMILVAAIFTKQKSADSLLQILKPQFANAYTLPSTIYMGCMH